MSEDSVDFTEQSDNLDLPQLSAHKSLGPKEFTR